MCSFFSEPVKTFATLSVRNFPNTTCKSALDRFPLDSSTLLPFFSLKLPLGLKLSTKSFEAICVDLNSLKVLGLLLIDQ